MKINPKNKELISFIKGKKNKGISDEYVLNILNKYSKDFEELLSKNLEILMKNKVFKELVREIRTELYKVYGVFQVKRQGKKTDLIVKLENAKNLNEIKDISKELLKLHTSSRERLNEYDAIYSEIFKITKPKIIIDLASGLNPCSLILNNFKGECYAYDISESDVNLLNKYFKIAKKYGINGRAYEVNLDSFKFHKGDVCFLFKFLDLAENRKEFFVNLIKSLDCNYLVVSFSKKTISMKNMRNVKRKWFINLLSKLNLKYEVLDFENEIFYLIKLK